VPIRTVTEPQYCRRLTHESPEPATYWIRAKGRAVEYYCAVHYHSRMNDLYNTGTPRESGHLKVETQEASDGTRT
jgi:hypothetical protein